MNEFCFQFCLLTEHGTPRDLEHFGNPNNEKLLKNQTYNEWSVV